MEPEPFPRAPAALRIREFEAPAVPRRTRRLAPLKTPGSALVEVY